MEAGRAMLGGDDHLPSTPVPGTRRVCLPLTNLSTTLWARTTVFRSGGTPLCDLLRSEHLERERPLLACAAAFRENIWSWFIGVSSLVYRKPVGASEVGATSERHRSDIGVTSE